MAKKNNADITTKINEVLDQVEAGSISPAEVKALFEDLRDSYLNRIDHLELVGFRPHSVGRAEPYIAGEGVHNNGAFWINKSGSQGTLDSNTFLQISKRNVLFFLNSVNTATAYSIGDLVRHDHRAFKRKQAGTVNNVAAVYDEYEFDQVQVPVGYYGETYSSDTIYVEDMVVLATIDGRKVYLRNTSEEVMLSTDVKSEWIAGDWEYVCEAGVSDPVILTELKALNDSDCGRVFFVKAEIDIDLTNVSKGFFCELISYDENGIGKFISTNNIISMSGFVLIAEKGRAFVKAYNDSDVHVSGDLIEE